MKLQKQTKSIAASLLICTLLTPSSAFALRPTTEGTTEKEVSAGLEEDGLVRLKNSAREMQRQGWIPSAQHFQKHFLQAARHVSERLALASTPNGRTLWSRRRQALSDLSTVLTEVFARNPAKSSTQILGESFSGKADEYYHAVVWFPSQPSPFLAIFTINRKSENPKLSIELRRPSNGETAPTLFEAVGSFTFGKDRALSKNRPLLHLDIRDGPYAVSWWGHRNLFHAWRLRKKPKSVRMSPSERWAEALETYMAFQEKTIQRIQELAKLHPGKLEQAVPVQTQFPGLKLLSLSDFENRFSTQAGKAPPDTHQLMLLELPTKIHIYWQYNLAPIMNSILSEKAALMREAKGRFWLTDEAFGQPAVLPQKTPGLVVWDKMLGEAPPFKVRLPLISHRLGDPFPWTLPRLIFAALTGTAELPALEMLGAWSFEVEGRRYLAIALAA